MRCRISRIESHRPLEHFKRLPEFVSLEVVKKVEAAQNALIGVETLGPLAQNAAQLRFTHLRRDRRYDLYRELVLQLEDVGGLAGKTVAPNGSPAFTIGQLCRQSNLGAGTSNTAREHIAHLQLAADVV